MDINDLIYETAKVDVGTWEWAKGHNPKVLQYYKDAGVPQDADEVPWCAAFVGAILARCGVTGTGSLLARSYEDWGREVRLEDARRGDIVILSRGQPWQGHVAIFEGTTNNKVYLLGGNQGDQVNVTPYPKSRVVAVRRAVDPASVSRPVRRTNPQQSTSVRWAGAQVVGSVVSMIEALRSLDGLAQAIVLGVAGVVIVGALWIARERIRRIIAGLG